MFANSDTIIILDSALDLDSFSSVSCSLFFWVAHVDHRTIIFKNICFHKGIIGDISRFFKYQRSRHVMIQRSYFKSIYSESVSRR